MPGDLCVAGGSEADTLTTRAENHDPQHVPYGICWLESAEAKDETAIEQRAASSSGCATEQPMPEPEPPTPDGAASSSSASPPQSLGKPCPKSIHLLQADRWKEAQGHVYEAHMDRGYELEALRQGAEQSWSSSLDLLSGGYATEQPV